MHSIPSSVASNNTYRTEYRNENTFNGGGLRGRITRCINSFGKPDSLFWSGLLASSVGTVATLIPVIGPGLGVALISTGACCMGLSLYKGYKRNKLEQRQQFIESKPNRYGSPISTHRSSVHQVARHRESTRCHRIDSRYAPYSAHGYSRFNSLPSYS